MREPERILGCCSLCGARRRAVAPGRGLAARGVSALFAGEARARSGLAYAAGFAGLFYLFKASAVSFALGWLGPPGVFLGYLWGASAPAAWALGLLAASELDRSPSLAGRSQALVGFLIGLWGTLHFVAETQAWWRLLSS